MTKIELRTPRASLYPVPVTLVTCDTKTTPANIITISWTGILCSHPPVLYISVRPERYSYSLLTTSRMFCTNIPSQAMLRQTDLCGNSTGAEVKKAEAYGLNLVDLVPGYPPAIHECMHHLFCKICDVLEFGSHHAFVTEVKHEFIDEKLYHEDHVLDYGSMLPVAYCRRDYFSLGEKIGSYGFTLNTNTSKKA